MLHVSVDHQRAGLRAAGQGDDSALSRLCQSIISALACALQAH